MPLNSLLLQVIVHAVALTWTDSPDAGTVNVYRADTSCSDPSAIFNQVATAVPLGGAWTDTGMDSGEYCYYVTGVLGGAESTPSNTFDAVITQSSTTVSGTISGAGKITGTGTIN